MGNYFPLEVNGFGYSIIDGSGDVLEQGLKSQWLINPHPVAKWQDGPSATILIGISHTYWCQEPICGRVHLLYCGGPQEGEELVECLTLWPDSSQAECSPNWQWGEYKVWALGCSQKPNAISKLQAWISPSLISCRHLWDFRPTRGSLKNLWVWAVDLG